MLRCARLTEYGSMTCPAKDPSVKLKTNQDLIAAREALGLSAPEMARRLNGTPYTSYWKIEAGERREGKLQPLVDPAVRWVSWSVMLEGKDPTVVATNFLAQAKQAGMKKGEVRTAIVAMLGILNSIEDPEKNALPIFQDHKD